MDNNISFKYKTREQSDPRGKAKVFYFCHPNNTSYLEHICEIILDKQDCAIYYQDYAEHASSEEELYSFLCDMQLFVFPITYDLLYDEDPDTFTIYSFAAAHHVPILPLLQVPDPGLIEDFCKRYDNLHFLYEYADDATSVSFDEKLGKFLSSVLLSDELIKRVQDAFDAYIFLSYRKKDRKYANDLIKLIHKNENCRNIAVWYDEFLIAGEPFDQAIRKALKECDVFTMLVTPNLLEDGNYVMCSEYPMAKEEGKLIIPVESISTDRTALEKYYNGIPECIDPLNENALLSCFSDSIRHSALSKNDQPEHSYLIGLAYLEGIYAERNTSYAIELITSAADAGLIEAEKKLVNIYSSGIGIKADLGKAIEMQKKIVETYRSSFDTAVTDEDPMTFFSEVHDLAKLYDDALLPERSEAIYLEYISILENNINNDKSDDTKKYRSLLSSFYNNISYLYYRYDDTDNAKLCLEKSIALDEYLYAENPDHYKPSLAKVYLNAVGFYKTCDMGQAFRYGSEAVTLYTELAREEPDIYENGLANAYNMLGTLYSIIRDDNAALTYYNNAAAIIEKLSKRVPGKYEFELSVCLHNLGGLLIHFGRNSEAEEYLTRSLKLTEDLYSRVPERYCEPLARLCHTYGGFLSSQKKWDTAILCFSKAVSLFEKLYSYNPVMHDEQLATSLLYEANCLEMTGAAENAKACYIRSGELFRKISKRDPKVNHTIDIIEHSLKRLSSDPI